MKEKIKTSKKKIFQKLLMATAGVNLVTSVVIILIIYASFWGILSAKTPDLGPKLDKSLLLLLPLALVLFSVIFNFLNASIISAKIVNPILKLTELMKKVREGKLDIQANIKTNDEIEFLAETFNEMLREVAKEREKLAEMNQILEIKVRARTRELEESALRLEEQVRERTKDLREKIEELEKFHRLTVGRELKMIELKEEIKRLKNELEKLKSGSP